MGKTRLTVGLVLITLLTGLVAWWQYVWLRDQHTTRNHRELQTLSRELARSVDEHIHQNPIIGATRAIGVGNHWFRELLTGESEIDHGHVLTNLDVVRQEFDADIVYVMNRDGDVVASTSYDNGKSLTGQNYSFRPYFLRAIGGHTGIYCAVGVTTGERGIYYASPLYLGPDHRAAGHPPNGVVAIKVAPHYLDRMLESFPRNAALVSPDGLVFAASRPEMRYRLIEPLAPERLEQLIASQQFGNRLTRSPQLVNWPTGARADKRLLSTVRIPIDLRDGNGTWHVVTHSDPGLVFPMTDWLPTTVLILLVGLLSGLYLIVSERKLTADQERREALETAARTYESIFDSVKDAIFVHDWDTFAILDVNRTTEAMYGMSADQIRNGDFSGISTNVEPYTEARALELLARARTGTVPTFEWQARNGGGGMFWVEIALSRAMIQGKWCIIASVRDISDRKELEGQLIRSERMAAVGTLAAGVAHEFNNINTSALGYTALCLDQPELPGEVRPWLERVKKGLSRSTTIVQTLLTFSGAQGPDPILYDLHTTIRDVLDLLSVELLDEEIAVTLDLKPIPQVSIKPDLISQMVHNLILNAVHATLGQRERRIHISTFAQGRHTGLSVRDNGHGIRQEDIRRIFTPFYSRKGEHAGEPTQAKIKGTGLGLSLCQRIAEDHGGQIRVDTELGIGSTFTVLLPLPENTEKPPPLDAPAEAPRRQDPASATPATTRVLIVDDDDDVRDFLHVALTRRGYDLQACRSIEEGLRCLEEERFDAVLLDWVLPESGGSEFLKSLGKLDIPFKPGVVVITGLADAEIDQAALSGGADRVIHKPFDLNEIQGVLSALTEGGN